MPKISVLMSAYNAEEFVVAAVKSILRQTVKDFEFLIVDDASTDGTWWRLKDIAETDSRIQLSKNRDNVGKSENLNDLFERSSGEYIAFMDADDLSVSTRFEQQLKVLESGVDLCGSWAINFGVGKNRIMTFPKLHDEIALKLLFDSAFAHPSVMMKRRIFEETKFRKAMFPAVDYDYWSRVVNTFNMANCPRVLLARRLSVQQISATGAAEQTEARRKISLCALADHGIFPNAREQGLHMDFVRPRSHHLHSGAPGSPESLEDVMATRDWIKKLVYGLTDVPHSGEFLARHWYMYCLRSASYGLRIYRIFRSYNPNKSNNQTLSQRMILLCLCALRIRYHSGIYKLLFMLRQEQRKNRKYMHEAIFDLGDLLAVNLDRRDRNGRLQTTC